jgi:hypothetical protein
MSIGPTIARQVITAVPQGSRAIAYGERARDLQRELMGETVRYVEPEGAGAKCANAPIGQSVEKWASDGGPCLLSPIAPIPPMSRPGESIACMSTGRTSKSDSESSVSVRSRSGVHPLGETARLRTEPVAADVAVLATSKRTVRRARAPRNQSVDAVDRRHDCASKWSAADVAYPSPGDGELPSGSPDAACRKHEKPLSEIAEIQKSGSVREARGRPINRWRVNPGRFETALARQPNAGRHPKVGKGAVKKVKKVKKSKNPDKMGIGWGDGFGQ